MKRHPILQFTGCDVLNALFQINKQSINKFASFINSPLSSQTRFLTVNLATGDNESGVCHELDQITL